MLEVGCGSGVLCTELCEISQAFVYGIDIDLACLNFAHTCTSNAKLTCGDAFHLPFPEDQFDITLCHYLLMWTDPPNQVVYEMRRVTCHGGSVLALAEPDYGGRIDYPLDLAKIGAWQQEALRLQGADPLIGRRLRAIFLSAGLQQVEVGVLGGQWISPPGNPDEETDWQNNFYTEWRVIRSDLAGQVSPQVLQQLQERDTAATKRGERILFVPTFYAWGRVP